MREGVFQARLTLTDFISQIGGLLGLCLGFSVVSLIEIIYWFTIRSGRKLRQIRRRVAKKPEDGPAVYEPPLTILDVENTPAMP